MSLETKVIGMQGDLLLFRNDVYGIVYDMREKNSGMVKRMDSFYDTRSNWENIDISPVGIPDSVVLLFEENEEFMHIIESNKQSRKGLSDILHILGRE